MKRATLIVLTVKELSNISIHTLCEEGDDVEKFKQILQGISIHTLCEEGDKDIDDFNKNVSISIHTLCEEGDLLVSTDC